MNIEQTGEIKGRIKALVELLESDKTKVLGFSAEREVLDIWDGVCLVDQQPSGTMDIRLKIFNPLLMEK